MIKSKFVFCHLFLPTLARNNSNAKTTFHYKFLSKSVCKPSLPVVFTDVCVGAVGRENNWVIVPIDNYEEESIHNGA